MRRHTQETTDFWLKAFGLAILIWTAIFLLFKFVISNDIVQGDSMQPNFFQGERLVSLKHKKVKRGAVIILSSPDNTGDYYIKRVIGLPGDKIVYKDDTLYINGKAKDEPYLNLYKNAWYLKQSLPFTANFSLKSLAATNTIRVPKKHYFVLGDNRTISNDSRSFGYVPQRDVQSVVVLRYWPIYTFKLY
ncbi:signal peptidase I [Agrilactobacillus fermenti]|uniref:signal peptidase I n=1 Tax=Agrilactobacillus fermenti TaxID=2586909 RepID=UPI001E62CA21|nr:signal peptidase I [Agrilactobacillus fermenti]MCD2256151.1 signal peptidase I [Agrilactobacillus fermenti]